MKREAWCAIEMTEREDILSSRSADGNGRYTDCYMDNTIAARHFAFRRQARNGIPGEGERLRRPIVNVVHGPVNGVLESIKGSIGHRPLRDCSTGALAGGRLILRPPDEAHARTLLAIRIRVILSLWCGFQ